MSTKIKSPSIKVPWRIRLYVPEEVREFYERRAEIDDRDIGKIISKYLEENYGRIKAGE